MQSQKRLFVVANRLPVCIAGDKEHITIKAASGGLVSAVKSYLEKGDHSFSEVYWTGVPGCTPAVWNEVAPQIADTHFTYLPVMVVKEQYENYYNGFSNSVLWPLFHYFPSFVDYTAETVNDYVLANRHFAEVLQRNCRENDVVWIHDYHLLPLAAMLRKAIPGITIGFFLHIPFPSFELFRMLPKKWQEELLKGLLGADLIGFHTIDYASHFLHTVQNILGICQEKNILRYKGRLIKVDAFPISIDYTCFSNAYSSPAVVSLREALREKMNSWKIIFSVDRLDYTKGVQNRLRAYASFLKRHPGFLNKVVFILVIVPSRDNIPKYKERRKIIEELVSSINGELSTLHWQPIHYQYNSLSFEEMLALYTICDLALITPLRDGMNLVAKEFVASRQDQRGVLILSEMAGAARELTDALLINPNDTNQLAETIHTALTMPQEEQQQRMEKMQKQIANYDVTEWAKDFMQGLANIKQKQKSFQEIFLDDYSKVRLLDSYRSAKKRLLFLDYDGTLVPFSSAPELVVPSRNLRSLLQALGSVDGNKVFLISGRSSHWLEQQFHSLPVNLVAEHGARVKYSGSDWQTEVQTHSEWKGQVQTIMEMFERRCPRSFIEEKEFSIAWHYRNADVEQGRLRALELTNELRHCLAGRSLEVVAGNKIIEVRNRGIDKGTAIKKILAQEPADFVFAAGDDKTDEDMFKMLVGKENCFTIKVGPNASYAQYNLLKPQMVLSLLENMRYISASSVL
jgi:trehalose 6-phosphate synthase/phosphatase